MSDDRTVKLKGDYQAFGKKLDTIVFREPLGADVAECGIPMREISSNGITFDTPAVMRLIVRLGEVPESVVKAFTYPDFRDCMGMVMSFFRDEGAGSPPV